MTGKKEHREIELKYKLNDRESYEHLCQELGKPESDSLQVNHFFQSPDARVPGERGVIRIRLEKERAVFTVKLGGPLKDGLASAMEYEEPWQGSLDKISSVAETLWDAGFQGMKALEKAFGNRFPLVWAGSMENRRKVYNIEEDLCLEVDASRYSNSVEDFEVEVETRHPEKARPRLLSLLNDLGIRHEPQSETKYQRFLKYASCPKSRE